MLYNVKERQLVVVIMIEINKAYFDDKLDYSWLQNKLDDSFIIKIGDKSKLVYGYNGIGKSSLSSCLKEYNTSNNFMFLDYETVSQKYSGNEIVIAPYIFDLEKLKKSILEKENSIEFGSLSKLQGFTKTLAGKGPNFLKSYAKSIPTGKHPSQLLVSDSDYKSFLAKNPNVNPQTLFKIINNLETITKSVIEIDNYKKSRLKELLEKLKGHIEDNNKCPVCGSSVSDITSIIDDKIKTLEIYKSELVKSLETNNIKYDSKTIDEYLNLYNELSTNGNLLNDFVICGSDLNKHVEINKTIVDIAKDNGDYTSLLSKRTIKYNQIKTQENRFKRDVARYLKIDTSSIIFDDSECEITITFDRNTNTYSTGERHILWFLVELYSFLGSDCSTLILDDPASSLDLANLYKIAFEIVRNAFVSSKTIVVFTHSADLINAINSQYPDQLDVYYLEEYKSKIFCEEIDYKGKNIVNIIDTEHFSACTPKVYESLKKRDYEGDTSAEHNVYHYSPTKCVSSVDSSLSNEYLYGLIDSYSSLSKQNFYTDSFNKVLFILALRVWLEKALYNLIPPSDTDRQNDYLAKYKLQEKITIIENKSSNYSGNLFDDNGISKEEIMSKKVLLNQNAHYYSQIMPFAYAINLSLDDVNKEILEIKNIFGC